MENYRVFSNEHLTAIKTYLSTIASTQVQQPLPHKLKPINLLNFLKSDVEPNKKQGADYTNTNIKVLCWLPIFYSRHNLLYRSKKLRIINQSSFTFLESIVREEMRDPSNFYIHQRSEHALKQLTDCTYIHCDNTQLKKISRSNVDHLLFDYIINKKFNLVFTSKGKKIEQGFFVTLECDTWTTKLDRYFRNNIEAYALRKDDRKFIQEMLSHYTLQMDYIIKKGDENVFKRI